MDTIDQKQFQTLLNRNVLLPLGLGLLTIIFFIAIIFYLLSLARWVEKTDTVIRAANEVVRLIVDQETGLRGFLITGKNEFLEPYTHGRELTPAAFDNLRALVVDSERQKQRVETTLTLYRRWSDYAENGIADARAGKSAQSIVSPERGKQVLDDIRRYSNAIIADEEDIKAERGERARILVMALVGGFFAVSLLFNALLAQLGRRQLIYLSNSYEKLLTNLNAQNEVLQHTEWLRIGQLELTDKIIGQLPLPILCQNVLTYLAERIDIAVGALYVSQDEETYRREANYGFSKESAQREQRFARWESLVGQAAAEKRIIHLSDVAVDYLKINSGLGEAAALHLVIVPIVADIGVIAVLELGFFRAPATRDFELLKRVSENIGAALAAANYRRRLHDTLLEMQQLNDELQTQQEELRAANEELEGQSQSLEESQQRLERQREELELANDSLQENNEMLRTTRGLLEERALQLEQASRYKSEFMANMSHELRTPLNSALILSKLLADNADNNLSEEQVRFAAAIHSAGKDLLALINDVLDLSKVEAGKIDIVPDEVSVPRIADMLTAHFQQMAAEKNLEFAVVVADGTPEKVCTDRQRLDQILRNLLSNALKFTEQGSVKVTIAAHGDDSIAFAVSDSGIGIPAAKHELIFEPFRQIDGASNRRYGGSGLGLSISRDLARLLGGAIDIVSSPGAGSTFTLIIPIEFRGAAKTVERAPALWQREHEHSSTHSAHPVLDNCKILIVDDDVRNIFALTSVLENKGATVEIGRNGLEAIKKLNEIDDIDLVLMDIMMPEMDGYEAMTAIRNDVRFVKLPIIAVTAKAMRDDQERCLRAGASDYVAKPVDLDRLISLIREWSPQLQRI